jgi:hypothetical protein
MGTISSAGPGFSGFVAALSAPRAWDAAERGSATRTTARVTFLSISSKPMPSRPSDWRSRPPDVAQATSPQMSSIGTPSRCAATTPVTTFVAPGPEVTTTAGTFPVARQ